MSNRPASGRNRCMFLQIATVRCGSGSGHSNEAACETSVSASQRLPMPRLIRGWKPNWLALASDSRKWSGRWESNPHGRRFKVYQMRRFVVQRRLRAIGVRIRAINGLCESLQIAFHRARIALGRRRARDCQPENPAQPREVAAGDVGSSRQTLD